MDRISVHTNGLDDSIAGDVILLQLVDKCSIRKNLSHISLYWIYQNTH